VVLATELVRAGRTLPEWLADVERDGKAARAAYAAHAKFCADGCKLPTDAKRGSHHSDRCKAGDPLEAAWRKKHLDWTIVH
jgi:hypothetical protein